jgi:uncharacterized membrane protein
MSMIPPVDPCLPDPQLPRSRRLRRARVILLIILLFFAGLLLLLGQDVETALIGAGSACVVAGQVAYRLLGTAVDVSATLTVVVVVLLFAVLLLWHGYDPKAALAGAALGGVVAGEVSQRVLDPRPRQG